MDIIPITYDAIRRVASVQQPNAPVVAAFAMAIDVSSIVDRKSLENPPFNGSSTIPGSGSIAKKATPKLKSTANNALKRKTQMKQPKKGKETEPVFNAEWTKERTEELLELRF
jgi:hypothetical protein